MVIHMKLYTKIIVWYDEVFEWSTHINPLCAGTQMFL